MYYSFGGTTLLLRHATNLIVARCQFSAFICGRGDEQWCADHYFSYTLPRLPVVIVDSLSEKIAVMVVTSSADRPQIYSERVRSLSGLNHTKLEQVRLIQDLLQA